ncbi:aromatic ring-hydroxylating dioxygenase subunit alpha [Oscillatoria sp. FACHB-1407]|uniref:aromatic ring-hydroxylating dioxygenase subunit alpha n=1 Tax=Oscillatoria sp. FACHB-1407 TaxID=2692847 RepID=UPI0016867B23|nr:aromatic ring-hydroxylating dioxygenase subunit alpha [Oscillatoria sp. FACHB-1407]MBD2461952.1 aromatic ring-hydroxylating dioxygenase subunit alpha [Oscillatoria sp. FACHB-1407]
MLDTPLSTTSTRDVRRLGINLNHWYVVAQSGEVQAKPVGVTLWHQAIVLYRDQSGEVHALEDRCPHRHVRLSEGNVVNGQLECIYHGWQFNAEGRCAAVPYLADNQKLPTCQIRTYPVREQDGFIWLFPGDATLQHTVPLMGLPEWDHLNYIGSFTTIECEAHYSYLIENLMDMHHGHLHQSYQAWAEAKLEDLEETGDRVVAHYQAQSYYTINKIWSVAQLFIPAMRQLHPEPLDVSYVYPHWASKLGDDFRIYCLLCPVHETHTRAYLIHFTSLNAFPRLHKLPEWFRRFIKDSFFGSAKGLLDGLVRQDVLMIEQEQQAYLANPQRKGYELNRALGSVQRLMQRQASGVE